VYCLAPWYTSCVDRKCLTITRDHDILFPKRFSWRGGVADVQVVTDDVMDDVMKDVMSVI